MSRELFLSMDEGEVLARCLKDKVGISVVEALPNGGTRLVCSSGDGAATMRRKLKSKVITGEVERALFRPVRPKW